MFACNFYIFQIFFYKHCVSCCLVNPENSVITLITSIVHYLPPMMGPQSLSSWLSSWLMLMLLLPLLVLGLENKTDYTVNRNECRGHQVLQPCTLNGLKHCEFTKGCSYGYSAPISVQDDCLVCVD